MNGEKTTPIKNYIKALGSDYVGIVGIGADEPNSLDRMRGRQQISLLEKYGYTTEMALDLCKEYGLLSPIYNGKKRQGCWFCPNGSISEFAKTKQEYPELWVRLRELSLVPNTTNRGFKYGRTFQEIDAAIDRIIEAEQNQMTIFDLST